MRILTTLAVLAPRFARTHGNHREYRPRLVSGHWSAWQAARVEVRQDEEARRAREEPVEQRIVEKLVEETTVELVSGK